MTINNGKSHSITAAKTESVLTEEDDVKEVEVVESEVVDNF